VGFTPPPPSEAQAADAGSEGDYTHPAASLLSLPSESALRRRPARPAPSLRRARPLRAGEACGASVAGLPISERCRHPKQGRPSCPSLDRWSPCLGTPGGTEQSDRKGSADARRSGTHMRPPAPTVPRRHLQSSHATPLRTGGNFVERGGKSGLRRSHVRRHPCPRSGLHGRRGDGLRSGGRQARRPAGARRNSDTAGRVGRRPRRSSAGARGERGTWLG